MAGNHNSGSGGARIGAGRKRKPIAEKMQEGNRGHSQLTVMQFDNLPNLEGREMPKPNSILAEPQEGGKPLQATEIYASVWAWLEARSCATLISPQLLDRYAMSFARWIHCEETISKFGYLAKHPTTGEAMQSPFVKMSHDYLGQANRLWTEIFAIVRENSMVNVANASNPQDDMMESLLKAKK